MRKDSPGIATGRSADASPRRRRREITETGAGLLVRCLLAEGLSTLFGIPGVDTLGVYDSLLDHPDMRAINVRHEQAAVFMADGFARSSGQIAVALTSGGPGALNSLTAMATAHNDSVPLLHVVNENPAHVRRKGRGYFHDLSDQMAMFRPVTDFTIQITLAEEIPDAVHLAVGTLRNRRPRPALIEIAGEVLHSECDAEPRSASVSRPRPALAADLDASVELLSRAEAPIIWAGGGVITSGATKELVALAEALEAPVLTSQAGKGSFPVSHRLHVGNWANERPVRDLIARSDALLAVGTRFSYFPTGGWSLELPTTLIQIDLDAEEIGRNYRAEVGIVGDARSSLQGILDRLSQRGHRPATSRAPEAADVREQIAAAVGRPVEIDVLDQIRASLPADARVFNDPTTIAFWARSHWPAPEPRTWFVPSGFGTLGYALPAAIGSCVARPDVASVAIIGDAGVMFTIQDLMTAVEHDLPVVVLVFNDEGYGVERRHQDHLYGRRSGVDVRPPDFVALAAAFGLVGERVDDLSRVGDAVESAVGSGRPTLIEIPNRFDHPGYGSFARWPED